MKEKIKSIITVIVVFYMVTICLLTLFTLNNVSTFIYVSMQDFSSDFLKLNEKVKMVDDIECRNSIQKMINKSEEYVIREKLDLRELRKNGSLIPLYSDILKKCNIKENDRKYLSSYVLNSVLTYESFFQDAMYDYEISLKDIEGRIIGEVSMNHSKLNSNKYLEIELINRIIEVQNEE